MNNYIFVDEDINISTGSAAKAALETVSDVNFLSDRQGVVRVTKDRWRIAQRYEHRTWMEKGAHALEDRNDDHYKNFDDYNALNKMIFTHAIELGCGPFTNLRYIANICEIEKCTLLDPLVEFYLNHRNCRYTRKFLRVAQRPLFEKLSASYFHRGIRRLTRGLMPRLLYSGISVKSIVPKPIEEYSVADKYDLVVMINVIEHCYDVNSVFHSIETMTKKDAIFVFQDKYYDHEKVSEQIKHRYDAGHPLRVDRYVVDDFLEKRFHPLFKEVKREASEADGVDLGFDSIYFIGKKK